jgi:hypothetical protein
MQSASTAHTTSLNALSGLTYIDTLVSGATSQGLFSIIVAGNLLNSASISALQSSYGYNVQAWGVNDLSSYKQYIISW